MAHEGNNRRRSLATGGYRIDRLDFSGRAESRCSPQIDLDLDMFGMIAPTDRKAGRRARERAALHHRAMWHTIKRSPTAASQRVSCGRKSVGKLLRFSINGADKPLCNDTVIDLKSEIMDRGSVPYFREP